MADQEPLKITIEDLDPIDDEEKPLLAEPRGRDLASTAGKAAIAAGELARKAWESDTRRKATDKVASSAAAVTTRTTEAVRDKVAETVEEQARATAAAVEARVREIDWQAEAQQLAVGGLRWLGIRLEELAQRFSKPDTPAENESNSPGNGKQ
jgi:hypothetical protein